MRLLYFLNIFSIYSVLIFVAQTLLCNRSLSKRSPQVSGTACEGPFHVPLGGASEDSYLSTPLPKDTLNSATEPYSTSSTATEPNKIASSKSLSKTSSISRRPLNSNTATISKTSPGSKVSSKSKNKTSKAAEKAKNPRPSNPSYNTSSFSIASEDLTRKLPFSKGDDKGNGYRLNFHSSSPEASDGTEIGSSRFGDFTTTLDEGVATTVGRGGATATNVADVGINTADNDFSAGAIGADIHGGGYIATGVTVGDANTSFGGGVAHGATVLASSNNDDAVVGNVAGTGAGINGTGSGIVTASVTNITSASSSATAINTPGVDGSAAAVAPPSTKFASTAVGNGDNLTKLAVIATATATTVGTGDAIIKPSNTTTPTVDIGSALTTPATTTTTTIITTATIIATTTATITTAATSTVAVAVATTTTTTATTTTTTTATTTTATADVALTKLVIVTGTTITSTTITTTTTTTEITETISTLATTIVTIVDVIKMKTGVKFNFEHTICKRLLSVCYGCIDNASDGGKSVVGKDLYPSYGWYDMYNLRMVGPNKVIISVSDQGTLGIGSAHGGENVIVVSYYNQVWNYRQNPDSSYTFFTDDNKVLTLSTKNSVRTVTEGIKADVASYDQSGDCKFNLYAV